MNCSKSCFETIFVLCYLNLTVSGEEPGVGSRLTQLIAGVCDPGKSCAGGPGRSRR